MISIVIGFLTQPKQWAILEKKEFDSIFIRNRPTKEVVQQWLQDSVVVVVT